MRDFLASGEWKGRVMGQSQRSLLPLTGAAFAILFVVSFFVTGESPSADDPIEEIVTYYTDKQSALMLASILSAIGAVLFLFFVGHVRSVLRSFEGGPGTLSSVAAGGGIVAATGMLIFTGLTFVGTESTEGFEPATFQTLNALIANFFFPLAGGLLTFLLATGLVGVRARALPAWLAWSGIVIAVVIFTPAGFFAFLASILWILITSIVLWMGPSAAPSPSV